MLSSWKVHFQYDVYYSLISFAMTIILRRTKYLANAYNVRKTFHGER